MPTPSGMVAGLPVDFVNVDASSGSVTKELSGHTISRC